MFPTNSRTSPPLTANDIFYVRTDLLKLPSFSAIRIPGVQLDNAEAILRHFKFYPPLVISQEKEVLLGEIWYLAGLKFGYTVMKCTYIPKHMPNGYKEAFHLMANALNWNTAWETALLDYVLEMTAESEWSKPMYDEAMKIFQFDSKMKDIAGNNKPDQEQDDLFGAPTAL